MGGSEGHAVVAADVGGQATLLKEPLKHGEGIVFTGGGQRFAAQQISAGVIGDGEGIAVLAVAEQKLAFVGIQELWWLDASMVARRTL